MNLKELFSHFQHLYGRNNSVYTTSLAERTNILLTTTRRLQDAIRKQCPRHTLERTLANVVSRTFAVAGHFWRLPLTRAMCIKYPMGGCGYCFTSPCTCLPYQRREHGQPEPNQIQLSWSLGEHQQNLKALYGAANIRNGVDNALNRLFSEIAEILELQSGVAMIGSTASVIEMEYAQEIADVIAWTIAIAVILDIDLEKVVLKMYGNGCPSCLVKPCVCPKFVIIDGTIRHRIETSAQSCSNP